MTRAYELTKDLTALYLKYHKTSAMIPLQESFIEAFVTAQEQLSDEELSKYTKWHKARWPGLDW